MTSTNTGGTPATAVAETPRVEAPQTESVSAELLIEEVSIDGMCGVY
jgi:mycofactocin precursor